MKLPYSVVKRLMKKAIDGSSVKLVSKPAVEFAVVKAQEFIQNLARNSVAVVEAQGRQTLTADSLNITLDSLSLALRNLPKADSAKMVEGKSTKQPFGASTTQETRREG